MEIVANEDSEVKPEKVVKELKITPAALKKKIRIAYAKGVVLGGFLATFAFILVQYYYSTPWP